MSTRGGGSFDGGVGAGDGDGFFEEEGVFAFGGFVLALGGAGEDLLVEAAEDLLGGVFDAGAGGGLEDELLEFQVGVQEEVGVGELHDGGLNFLDAALGAEALAVGSDLTGILDDGGLFADQADFMGPAGGFVDPDDDEAWDVGGKCGGRGKGLIVGGEEAVAAFPFSPEDPDFLAVEGFGGFLVELHGLAEAFEEFLGAGEAELGDDEVAEFVVEVGGFELVEDLTDFGFTEAFAFEDLLVIPEGLAVADLEHFAFGVDQAGDGEAEVDAVISATEVSAFDLEALVEHVNELEDVGGDGLQGGELLDRGFEGELGLGGGLDGGGLGGLDAAGGSGGGGRRLCPRTHGNEREKSDGGDDPIFGHGRDVTHFLKGLERIARIYR